MIGRSAGNTYENDLKKHLLVHLHELLVPLLDVGCLLAGVGIVVGSGGWVVLVVLAPLDNLLEDLLVYLWVNASVNCSSKQNEAGRRGTYIGNGNGRLHRTLSYILKHVLDEHRALSDLEGCGKGQFCCSARARRGTHRRGSKRCHC